MKPEEIFGCMFSLMIFITVVCFYSYYNGESRQHCVEIVHKMNYKNYHKNGRIYVCRVKDNNDVYDLEIDKTDFNQLISGDQYCFDVSVTGNIGLLVFGCICVVITIAIVFFYISKLQL